MDFAEEIFILLIRHRRLLYMDKVYIISLENTY
jgi:hypothetical protein